VFLAAAALNILAALMAIFVLKPMRHAYTRAPAAPETEPKTATAH
jgi:OFA family oxalate/formate antiporter-like MFS transporter